MSAYDRFNRFEETDRLENFPKLVERHKETFDDIIQRSKRNCEKYNRVQEAQYPTLPIKEALVEQYRDITDFTYDVCANYLASSDIKSLMLTVDSISEEIILRIVFSQRLDKTPVDVRIDYHDLVTDTNPEIFIREKIDEALEEHGILVGD